MNLMDVTSFFRYYVIHRLPNLKFLDSTAVRDDERKEAKRAGAFMKVVSNDKVYDLNILWVLYI